MVEFPSTYSFNNINNHRYTSFILFFVVISLILSFLLSFRWLFHMFVLAFDCGMIVRCASESWPWPRPNIPLRRSLRYIYCTPSEQQGLS
jgi:hypothetical protein